MSKLQTVTFKPGEVIFFEKAAADALYIIQSGQVEVFKKNKEGNKVVVAVINSGQYLGEMAIFRGTPHSSNAAALSEVTAAKLSKEAVESQLKAAPSWLVALVRLLVTRLHASNELIKKHGIVDEAAQSAAQAISEKFKKPDAA